MVTTVHTVLALDCDGITTARARARARAQLHCIALHVPIIVLSCCMREPGTRGRGAGLPAFLLYFVLSLCPPCERRYHNAAALASIHVVHPPIIPTGHFMNRRPANASTSPSPILKPTTWQNPLPAASPATSTSTCHETPRTSPLQDATSKWHRDRDIACIDRLTCPPGVRVPTSSARVPLV